MNKCESFLSKISLKHIQIAYILLTICSLALELFLLTTSSALLFSYPTNSLFISICLISLLSSLILFSNFVLAYYISKDFSKSLKYFSIFLLIAYLCLGGGQLYLSILFSNIANYLIQEAQLCGNSEVFTEIYWEYKKLYYNCQGNLTGCECFTDKNCTLEIIIDFYNNFKCNGFCDVGISDCSIFIIQIIEKIKDIYVALNAIGFVFLIFFVGFIIIIVKFKLKLSQKQNYQRNNRSLRNFEGISEDNTSRSINIQNVSRSLNISAIENREESESFSKNSI